MYLVLISRRYSLWMGCWMGLLIILWLLATFIAAATTAKPPNVVIFFGDGALPRAHAPLVPASLSAVACSQTGATETSERMTRKRRASRHTWTSWLRMGFDLPTSTSDHPCALR